MAGDICISVSTYRKNPALINWLESVKDFGRIAVVSICDDDDGTARAVAEDYQAKYEAGQYPFQIVYCTGPNKGVAKNKNRGIKFFLEAAEAKDCKWLVLSDDDIQFRQSELGEPMIGDLLVKAATNSNLRHITGYLGGSFGKINDDGSINLASDPFFTQFPPIHEDEFVIQCAGTQGILLFFERGLVEKLGYYAEFRGRYGYEHANYSMRANRIEGRCPELYPVLKNCNRYFGCQGIPNDYEAKPEENSADFLKYRVEVYKGIGLHVGKSGV